MENVELFKGYNKKLKGLHVIKTVNNIDDFMEVIKVFRGKPYYEILSDQDCEEEYNLYVEKGIVLGCYVDDKIAGINCIVNEPDVNHSIKFSEKDKVAYYSGLAVLGDYRTFGIGKLLVAHTDKYLNDLKLYDYSYARILCKESMSEGIFALNQFKDALDSNGNLIVDVVNYERNIKDYNGVDRRKYMVKTMSNNGHGFMRR